jgi:nitrate/nitrite-specific signal transduction histidine kinase
VTVRLGEENGQTCVAVADDGCGVPADVASKPGMGLHVMPYHPSVIGGQLAIQARAGGGTEVVCRVGPFPAPPG